MFIVSDQRYKIRRADGTPYVIEKGFVGDIPTDVAESWLVKAAINDGSIVCSGKKDRDIETAVEEGKEKAKATAKKKEEK